MENIFKGLSHAPISKKLMVVSMLVTTLTLTLICITFVYYDVVRVKKSLTNELVLISDVIGKRTAPALEFLGNEDQATKNLQDLTNKPSVLYACIFTIDRQIIAEYGNKKHPCQLAFETNPYENNGYLYINRNIISLSGKPIGGIFLVSDLRDISDHLQQIGIWVAILALAVFSIAYYFAQKLNNLIVRPIMILNNAASEISHGNYDIQVQEISHDEIGELTTTFNRMVYKVRDYKDHLENMVKERTKDLESALLKAEAANEAKSEFLRNMSHEFRTPLHGMINLASFGINDTSSGGTPSLHMYFQKIAKVTNRLTELVDGVLNISRMENGSEEFNMVECDLKEILDIIALEQRDSCKQKGIEFVYKVPDFDTKIICHRGKIIQVVTNLVGNAIKFTPAGKKITISSKRDEQFTTISVSDQGVGIPEGELEAIFGKFVQSTRTKTGSGGTGLGLAICRGIVLGHDGKIWAAANPDGEGSIFTFTISNVLLVGKKIVAPEDL